MVGFEEIGEGVEGKEVEGRGDDDADVCRTGEVEDMKGMDVGVRYFDVGIWGREGV